MPHNRQRPKPTHHQIASRTQEGLEHPRNALQRYGELRLAGNGRTEATSKGTLFSCIQRIARGHFTGVQCLSMSRGH